MSEEKVEAIRAGYDHFNRTGEPDWNLLDPEAEFDASAIGMGIVKGRDAVMLLLRDYAAAFEDFHIEPEEILAAGGSVVVAVVRDGGRMKGGSEIYNRFADVWTFRGDRVISVRAFTDKEQALKAAGLSE